ncbi:DnaB-like helicase C-terminal domain-containing protein [Siminovitchia sp. 179-K 8D1 HS]|uniref:DnaB-like helicase C-terminal domain-containing protein n=1 Tax=Siminovitchia sp. 179-K 8D1 HS TaxID=3142385 RepID=UPI0039A0C711
MTLLQDKKAILHVLAGLMANPHLLSQTREYELSVDDFPERHHQIIFGAISNLQSQGIEKITPPDIDGYLSEYPNQYRIFNENQGIEYLFKLQEIGEPDNFEYYYTRIRKYSLLRTCKKLGIDTTDLYDVDVLDIQETEHQQAQFDSMPIEDMVKHVEAKMVQIKDEFLATTGILNSHMSDNTKEILEELKQTPNYGANTISGYLNTVSRGQRLRKLFLYSSSTGGGKSRWGLANILNACVPEIYDPDKKQWIKTGATGRGLFITTELEEDEVKLPALCFIACVDEEKIHEAKLTEEEEARLVKATEILENTPMWFEELMDFDIADIEYAIERNVIKNDVHFICFDYIHSSLKILLSITKQGIRNLREDQILLLMGIALKNICNKYNVFISSATQLNDNYKEEGNSNLDQSSIRGSKALADKVDLGAIILPVNHKDEKIIETIIQSGAISGFGTLLPTHTINVYKNRGNRHKMIRIWIYFNAGTLRCKDSFVTDYKGNLIDNIKPRFIQYITEEESRETDIQEDELPESFMEEADIQSGKYDF